MSTLRISNIEAKSVPASATIDEKVKITNSSGDPLVFIDGKTSGITTVGINTTDGNITFDANSNVVVTGIITATKFVGTIEPTNLTVGGDLTIPDKIIHTGDTNTSLRFPAADTFSVETAGAERLRITSTGYIGINQNSPSTRLDVKQNNGVAYDGNAQSIAYNAARFLNTSGHTSGGTYTGFQFNITGDSQNRICSMGMITEASNSKASSLVFHTDDGGNRTEKLRITSSGLVGIGTDTPGTHLHVYHATNNEQGRFESGDAYSHIVIKDSGSHATAPPYFGVQSNDFRWVTHDGTSSAERVRIASDGNITFTGPDTSFATIMYSGNYTKLDLRGTNIANSNHYMLSYGAGHGSANEFHIVNTVSNLILRTSGNALTIANDKNVTINDGNLILANGHGIDFAATSNGNGSNQNELFDDYEEGDWQPKVSSGGANWSTTCRYTKIGRMVHIHGDITNQSGSGTTEIHNLPFSVDSKYGVWKIGYYANNGTTTNANSDHEGGIIHFQGSGYLRARVSGGTTNVTMGNNARVIFHGTYYTST